MESLLAAFTSYGLGGVVIGALFGLTFLLIKELKLMNETTDKRIDEQSNRHNDERCQWLSQLKDFGEVLRNFSGKPCLFDKRDREKSK